MAIYRTLYHAEVPVTSEGRITIPKKMREDCDFVSGDTLILRLEASEQTRQIMVTRKKREEDR